MVIARDGVIDHHLQGNNLYGIYNTLDKAVPGATLEPYFLWRVAPANVRLAESQGKGALNGVSMGVRLAGKLPSAFACNIELVLQRGSLGPYSIESWAGHWNINKTFAVATKPNLFVESNYATSNRNPSGRSWSTFDQIYPSSHNKLDFADQIGWKNVMQVRTGVTENAPKAFKFTQT